jgi:predicted esterase
MDERSFLEQVEQWLTAFLAGTSSLDDLIAAVLVPGWDAHRIGPRADEVVADLEALLVWRSERVLNDEELRAEFQRLAERVRRWLAGETVVPPAEIGT